ncbi:MAG TPA: single-stranded DNA-binding protein [Candidatus Moranbacteria bacterium]|nr:single-stranded DNA-binding protein [Candidatus Moranbacteria bacterium]
MNLNKVQIIGRLTRDPELRTTPSGQNVASFSVATTFRWVDKNGQKQEKPEFHNVVAWGRQAEIIAQYFTKGQEIYVEGRLQTRDWQDKDSGKKMYRTEIILEKFEFGAKPAGAAGAGSTGGGAKAAAPAAGAAAVEEEIPTINLDDEKDDINVEDVPF